MEPMTELTAISAVAFAPDPFMAQRDCVGHQGQRRLRRAHVLVIGAGGAGTAAVLSLATAGIGQLTAVDPQSFEPDNFNRSPIARLSDVGIPKVKLLERFLAGRECLKFHPVVGSCETLAPSDLSNVSCILSASNTAASRRHGARLAMSLKVPHVGVGAFDAREKLGGIITTWIPGRPDLACQACFLGEETDPQAESLLGPVVACLGAWAAHVVVRLITTNLPVNDPEIINLIEVDLERVHLDGLTVRRRQDCSVCRGVTDV